jgi:hypothetical protein
MRIRKEESTHRTLLRDLAEITAVLDVEEQLLKVLVAMASARRAMGLQLVF